MKINFLFTGVLIFFISCQAPDKKPEKPVNISGIYPHLAYYNSESSECGTGAVVPWANRLWVITYGASNPFGSSDKLYEITPDLHQIIREESTGGTHANRMIHNESEQLFIGPYVVNMERKVRVIPHTIMPGRLTGNARHLFDPKGKIYFAAMEEGFYEVDVHMLKVNVLYEDETVTNRRARETTDEWDSELPVRPGSLLPGAHGKGLYSGQGVLVYSNNGESVPEALTQFDIESGALMEWDGSDWILVRRNQFVEVTGPGGIYGNQHPETDPIWTTGWDHKSIIIGVRNPDGWNFFRLPKASHSYDGAHGWNTEWPRIRDIGTPDNPDYLMTMHGMFWRFPGGFSKGNTAGIRPRSAYLKVIGDFARWNNQLVFGCDDSAQKEFLNKRKVKGNIEGPGQSNSNLWFTPVDQPDKLGPNTSEGAVWLNEQVNYKEPSEPFLFAGWSKRCAWVRNDGNKTINFTFEVNKNGDGNWKPQHSIKVEAGNTAFVYFSSDEPGEWIRVVTDLATKATVHFSYAGEDNRTTTPDEMFNGLAKTTDNEIMCGLVYGLGDNRRALGMSANICEGDKNFDAGYYELDAEMNLLIKDDPATQKFINEKFAIPENVVSIEESSVIVVDDKGRRWRLPLGSKDFDGLTNSAQLRICREIATERDLFNCHGTFYELPAENADGFAKIRPVASHNFRINDYASYRGLLIMTGIDPKAGKDNPHIIFSDDKKAAVWAGVIDDLWKIGKPVGQGGPWKNAEVKASEPSDPYLTGFYDHKKLSLSHNLKEPVKFKIEVEPVGHGPWMTYKEVTIPQGETFKHNFPDNFQARWIRFTSNKDCKATAWLIYE